MCGVACGWIRRDLSAPRGICLDAYAHPSVCVCSLAFVRACVRECVSIRKIFEIGS